MAKDGKSVGSTSGPFGGTYLVTVIGAAVYFIGNADGSWEGSSGC